MKKILFLILMMIILQSVGYAQDSNGNVLVPLNKQTILSHPMMPEESTIYGHLTALYGTGLDATLAVVASLEKIPLRPYTIFTYTQINNTWQLQDQIDIPYANEYCQPSGLIMTETSIFVAMSYCDTYTNDAIYIFDKVNGSWELAKTITPPEPVANRWFASSIDLDDSVEPALLAVGSVDHRWKDTIGRAYIYEQSGEDWILQATLQPGDQLAGVEFGFSVAISRSNNDITVAVGAEAYSALGGSYYSGAVYVFRNTQGTWYQEAKIQPLDIEEGETSFFGVSVDLIGGADNIHLLVGANAEGSIYLPPAPIRGTGAAYVFNRTGTVWTQETKLKPQDLLPGASFGYFTKLTGTSENPIAIVSAPAGVMIPGKFYVYYLDAGKWKERMVLQAPVSAGLDHFGTGTSVAGTSQGMTIATGAPGYKTPSAVYVFYHDANVQNLAQEGDFETSALSRGIILNDWKTSDSSIKQICGDKGSDNSNCSIKMMGVTGKKTKIKQAVDISTLNLNVNDALLIRADAAVKKLAKIKVKLVLVYESGDRRVVSITSPKTKGFKRLLSTHGIFLSGEPIKTIKVIAIHNGNEGAIKLDNVQILVAPSSSPALLPMPLLDLPEASD